MRPETLLFIQELRAPKELTQGLFEECDLEALLGPNLVGYHREADFAFLFFTARVDLGPLFQ
jgi:hypothetical protein